MDILNNRWSPTYDVAALLTSIQSLLPDPNPSANGNVALRAQVLIDPKGVVRHHSVNDLGIGRSVDESLRLLQASKWVDERGEVCPVDWKRGQAAIDPSKSSEYFANKQE